MEQLGKMDQQLFFIRPLSLQEVRDTYYRFIREDFAPDEVRQWSGIEHLLAAGQYSCLGIFQTGNDSLFGYAFLALQTRAFRKEYLLDYFAIAKENRGKGIGSWFLAQLPGCFYDADRIFVEAENPEYAIDEEDRLTRKRRLSFYHKGGAVDCGLEARVYGVEYRILCFSGTSCSREDAVSAYEAFYHTFFSDEIYRKQVHIHDEKLTFRSAERSDCSLILHFIRELAAYEKMSDEVVATEELLMEWIFEKQKAEVIFACESGKEVGFALFFHNFSTFLGRAGIYLEDLFVLPEYRGKGIGRALLGRLAQTAISRGCGRLEWSCLDWNQPSIDFYLSLGAIKMDEWTVYRITGETLSHLAEEKKRILHPQKKI